MTNPWQGQPGWGTPPPVSYSYGASSGYPAPPGYPPQAGPTQPRPSGGTAITAAVLAFPGGLIGLVSALTALVGAALPDADPAARVFAAVFGLVSLGVAVGLIVGGIVLLTRRLAGRTVIVASWVVGLLLGLGSTGWTWLVAQNDPRSQDILKVAIVYFLIVTIIAGVTIAFALAPATRRWCLARRPNVASPPRPVW